MSPGGVTYALLDANTLLPPRLSDVLFDLCLVGLFSARWTAEIEEEFIRNWPRVVARVAKGRAGEGSVEQAVDASKAKDRLACYRRAAPEYKVVGHTTDSVRALVPAAVAAADKHVAAAALALLDFALEFSITDKVYIVSSNLKHLNVADLTRQGISVVKPGKFIDCLTEVDDARVGLALNNCINSLKNPPYTRARLLDALTLHGGKATAAHFARAWGEKPSGRP